MAERTATSALVAAVVIALGSMSGEVRADTSALHPTNNSSCPRGTVCDRALGVSLVPAAGVHQALPGKYPPHELVLQKRLTPVNDAVRLALMSSGTTRDANGSRAAENGMERLLRGTGRKGTFHCVEVHYGGASGCLVYNVPSSPSAIVAVVLCSHQFLYKILAPGSRLSPDQSQMLRSLRFIPRAGHFPPAR
jgi:hypothetical protein